MLGHLSATANFCLAAIRGGKDGKGGDGDSKLSGMNVHVGNLSIIDTSPTSMTFSVNVNLTNPTNYSATIPYFNINVLVNGTHLAQAIVEDMEIKPGNNTNLLAKAVWDPLGFGGPKGKEVGAEMLSQYISGMLAQIPSVDIGH